MPFDDATLQIVKHLEQTQLYFWRARVLGVIGRGPDDPMTKLTPEEIDGTIRAFGNAIKQIEMLHGPDPRTGNTGVDYPGSGHHYQKYREMNRGLLKNQIKHLRDDLAHAKLMDADPKAQKRIREMIEGCEREIEVLRRIDREQAEADARLHERNGSEGAG